MRLDIREGEEIYNEEIEIRGNLNRIDCWICNAGRVVSEFELLDDRSGIFPDGDIELAVDRRCLHAVGIEEDRPCRGNDQCRVRFEFEEVVVDPDKLTVPQEVTGDRTQLSTGGGKRTNSHTTAVRSPVMWNLSQPFKALLAIGTDEARAALPEAVAALVQRLGVKEHWNVRMAIYRALGAIGTPEAVAALAPEGLKKRITTLANGKSVEKLGVKIEAVPMYNLTAARLRFHNKGRGNGYVMTFGGKRVYVSGDTEDIPEMRALKKIDAAFVCMNLPYTMTPEQAADAVREELVRDGAGVCDADAGVLDPDEVRQVEGWNPRDSRNESANGRG